MARLFVLLLSLAAFTVTTYAQVRVELKIPRRLYMMYEPILATVHITNVAGRDLMLADTQAQQWFLFQVRTADDRPIGARDPNYEVPPLVLSAGQTLKRTINLTELYPIDELGMYRIRASVHVSDMDRFFTSLPDVIEISEGRPMWEQQVGVSNDTGGPGGTRQITLLQFRQPKDNMLYARVQDVERGLVLCTYPLGRLIAGNNPAIQLDKYNRLHVLQVVAPKVYLYSQVGPDGEWIGQRTYSETKTRPQMVAKADGEVSIKGGQENVNLPTASTAPPPPKLSDRPAGMPKE